MKIIISADSTCDLTHELVAKHNIRIIPLYINFGEESYRDGIDITPAEVFRRVEKDGVLPKTSAIPVGVFADEFGKYLKEADAVIHFSISSDFSSSYQSATIAAAEFENIYTFDTKNLSTGQAFLILKACELAEAGHTPEEIIEQVSKDVKKVDASFVIENLNYLYKGGRCSALAHLGANILQIKPCIEVRDGKMCVGKKYRGKYAAVLSKYVADRLENVEADESYAFITYSESLPEYVDTVKEAVMKYGNFKKIYTSDAGCTVSTHCGRNTIGVLYLRKDEK